MYSPWLGNCQLRIYQPQSGLPLCALLVGYYYICRSRERSVKKERKKYSPSIYTFYTPQSCHIVVFGEGLQFVRYSNFFVRMGGNKVLLHGHVCFTFTLKCFYVRFRFRRKEINKFFLPPESTGNGDLETELVYGLYLRFI